MNIINVAQQLVILFALILVIIALIAVIIYHQDGMSSFVASPPYKQTEKLTFLLYPIRH